MIGNPSSTFTARIPVTPIGRMSRPPTRGPTIWAVLLPIRWRPIPLGRMSRGMSRVITDERTAASKDVVTARANVPAMIAGSASHPAAESAARTAMTAMFHTWLRRISEHDARDRARGGDEPEVERAAFAVTLGHGDLHDKPAERELLHPGAGAGEEQADPHEGKVAVPQRHEKREPHDASQA